MDRLEHLRTRELGRNYLMLERVDSTNNYLKEQGAKLPHGTAVTARYQYAGRGRYGKSWADSQEGALKMSVLLKGIAAEQAMLLPLVTGIAVSQALERLSGGKVQIKWPNDLICGDKKLVGILCETRMDPAGMFAVCGIGINLLQTREFFFSQDLPHAGSLYSETGVQIQPETAASEVLGCLEEVLDRFLQGGFNAIREEYTSRCITLGREVRVIEGQKERRGQAVGIGPEGELLCKFEEGISPVRSGEASVRGLYGYV